MLYVMKHLQPNSSLTFKICLDYIKKQIVTLHNAAVILAVLKSESLCLSTFGVFLLGESSTNPFVFCGSSRFTSNASLLSSKNYKNYVECLLKLVTFALLHVIPSDGRK